MGLFTFTKAEKLCSQKTIGEIFLTGRSFICYPLKVVWIETVKQENHHPPAMAAFSVPKKNFRKAHDRNTIRRKMRESYRFIKCDLYDYLKERDVKIAFMLIYIGNVDQEFLQMQSSMAKTLERLKKEIKSGKDNSAD